MTTEFTARPGTIGTPDCWETVTETGAEVVYLDMGAGVPEVTTGNVRPRDIRAYYVVLSEHSGGMGAAHRVGAGMGISGQVTPLDAYDARRAEMSAYGLPVGRTYVILAHDWTVICDYTIDLESALKPVFDYIEDNES